ncbi:hypothetical protein HOA93_06045 [bacterium]|nr:hypothetical protein [bacterium]
MSSLLSFGNLPNHFSFCKQTAISCQSSVSSIFSNSSNSSELGSSSQAISTSFLSFFKSLLSQRLIFFSSSKFNHAFFRSSKSI